MSVSAETTNAPALSHNLLELLSSSEPIQARIKQFEDSKAASDAAYAKLNLGTDAQAALDYARSQKAEADALVEQAKRNFDESISVLASAQAEATSMLARAAADAAAVRTKTDSETATHTEWMTSTKAALDERERTLAAAQAASDAARVRADAAAAAAETARAAADAEMDAAKTVQADLAAKAARLAALHDQMQATLPQGG